MKIFFPARNLYSAVAKVLAAWLVFTLSVTGAVAQAAGEPDTTKINLNKLLDLSFEDLMNVKVITATQNLQKSIQAPATVKVITMEQIRLRGYRNLAEVLNDLPGFIVYDKSDPQAYNTVSLGGIFRQDYFVILMDGVRISSPTNEPLPILENFPIYLARQIEVMYGPGSALYGADAMAGVINIITQKAGDNNDVTVNAMGGTQGYSNVSAVFNKKLESDFRITVAGQYSYDAQPDFSKLYKNQYDVTAYQTGVFNTIYGTLTPGTPVTAKYEAPIKAYNMFASLEKGGFLWKVLHHYVQVPTSTTWRPDNGVYNKEVFYGHGITTGSASYTATTGKVKSISALVGSFYEVNPRSNYRNVYGSMEPGYKYSNGSMFKAEQQLHYSPVTKVNIIGGATYEIFSSLPKSPELQSPVNKGSSARGILLNSAAENNPGGIEAKFFPLMYTNFGSYLQAQYVPVEKISLTAGVRYDNNSRFGAAVNPRVGAVYSLFSKTTLKALFGTAFWAPSPHVGFESYGSFYTLDKGTTYRSSFWHLPNPGLKPMTSHTVELSLNQRIGKDISLTFMAHSTYVRNVIVGMPDNGHTNLYHNKFLGWDVDEIEVPFNKGHQESYGGSATANTTFDVGRVKFNAYTSLNYVDGSITDATAGTEHLEQATITPWQYRFGIDGKFKALHFSARLLQSGRQRTAMFDTDNLKSRKTIAGYSLMNISAGYTFKEMVTFYINVQNALNEKYRNAIGWESTETDGSFQDPLRMMVGVRVGF